MRILLMLIGLVAIFTALVLNQFEPNPVGYCMLGWSALWLGVWRAKRLRITAEHEAQAKPAGSALRFWSIRLTLLACSLLLGVGAYTQYLVRKHELPDIYQWQAMAWVLGINRPLPTLVKIPAGRFDMGSDEGGSDEKPVHPVTIPRQFHMGDSEVTFAQYDYYIWQMRRAGFKKPSYPEDTGGWGRAERPVINVDWDETQGYVNWLGRAYPQHMHCRLPSEAEWEYAARAGTTTAYYWGDKPGRDFANYGKEECCNGLAKGNDKWVNTAPVKQFKPNGFGLYDMSGNVYEWTQDRWHGDYTGAPQNGSAWETGNSSFRVLRGGSWFNSSYYVRSANRDYDVNGSDNFGIRVVCSPIER